MKNNTTTKERDVSAALLTLLRNHTQHIHEASPPDEQIDLACSPPLEDCQTRA